jgi:ribonuclease G
VTGGELVVEASPGERRIALRLSGRVAELGFDRPSIANPVGAIHLGRVVESDRRLGGALIEIDAERRGFLPASADPPVEGQALIVRISAPAVGRKGPVLTRHLELTGRYAVLTPTRPGVAVSRQIAGEGERRRLRLAAVAGLGEESVGALLRVGAAGQGIEAIVDDVRGLCDEWRKISAAADEAEGPRLLRSAPQGVRRWLERYPDIRRIATNVGNLRSELPEAWRRIEGSSPEIDVRRSAVGMFAELGIDDVVDGALARLVPLPGGGDLAFDETEALVAVDVNAGRDRRGATAVDLAAAAEIARQLRLRSLGGLIAIDFLRLDDRRARTKVCDALAAAMADDPNRAEILGWTRAGLVEAVRPRSEPSLASQLLEAPGLRPSAETVGLAALRRALRAMEAVPGRRIETAVSADVAQWLDGSGRPARREFETLAAGMATIVAEPGLGRDRIEVRTR